MGCSGRPRSAPGQGVELAERLAADAGQQRAAVAGGAAQLRPSQDASRPGGGAACASGARAGTAAAPQLLLTFQSAAQAPQPGSVQSGGPAAPFELNPMMRELMRVRQRRLDAPLLPVAQLAGAAVGPSGGPLGQAGDAVGRPPQGAVMGDLRSGQRGSQRSAAAGNAEEPIVLDDSSDEERGAAPPGRASQEGVGPSGRAASGGPGETAALTQASQPHGPAGALAAAAAGLPGNCADLRQGAIGVGGAGAVDRDPMRRVGSQAGSTGGARPPLPQQAFRNAAGLGRAAGSAGLGRADSGPSARASQDTLHSGASGGDAAGLGSQGSGGLARRGSEHSGMVRTTSRLQYILELLTSMSEQQACASTLSCNRVARGHDKQPNSQSRERCWAVLRRWTPAHKGGWDHSMNPHVMARGVGFRVWKFFTT